MNLKFGEMSDLFISYKRAIYSIFGFAVLAIFLDRFFTFEPKDFGFSVLVFVAVCRFFVF